MFLVGPSQAVQHYNCLRIHLRVKTCSQQPTSPLGSYCSGTKCASAVQLAGYRIQCV